MPPTAAELKPAPRCCCVLGTVADATELGSGHKAVLLRVALHEGVHEELMLAPSHAARAARQLLEAAKACGEASRDVTIAELQLAALEPKPVRHVYHNPLPVIEWRGGFTVPSEPAPRAPLVQFPPVVRTRARAFALADDLVDALWGEFCAGRGGVGQLADARKICSDTLREAFERRHGPQFALVRDVYRGRWNTDPAELRRMIEAALAGERVPQTGAARFGEPVTKPNGKIL